MAIVIVTGKPGGGKTYFCVSHILSKYFSYDKCFHEYIPRSDFTIYSNIDDLHLEHINLGELLQTPSGVGYRGDISVLEFFTIPYQRELLKKHHRIIYFIDEAQYLFDQSFRDNDVLYFFEYHRHLGIDLYFMCPDSSNLAKRLRSLAEYELVCAARSLSFFGEFRYHKIVQGIRTGTVVLRQRQDVFRLYRSMTKAEGEKVKKVATKYLVALAALLIVVPLSFYAAIHWFFGGKHDKFSAKKGSVVAPAVAGASVVGGVVGAPASNVAVVAPIIGAAVPDASDFFSHYQKLSVVESVKGKRLVVGDDGRIFTPEELIVLRSAMVVIGKNVYVPRVSEQRSNAGEGRAGAEADTRVAPPPAPLSVSGVVSGSSPVDNKISVVPYSKSKNKGRGVYFYEGSKPDQSSSSTPVPPRVPYSSYHR